MKQPDMIFQEMKAIATLLHKTLLVQVDKNTKHSLGLLICQWVKNQQEEHSKSKNCTKISVSCQEKQVSGGVKIYTCTRYPCHWRRHQDTIPIIFGLISGSLVGMFERE